MNNYKHLPRSLRAFIVRPRLLACIVLGVLTALLLPASWVPHRMTQWIIAWNSGACVYLISTIGMMLSSSQEAIRTRALRQDEGQIIILTLVITAAIASLGAILAELAASKDLDGAVKYAHVGLAALTILSSWGFTQTMFALHYAHDYYASESKGEEGGLDFPKEKQPDYADFLYFSCIIGTSAQTADVTFTSKGMRKTGLVHCILAFFFNTTLVGLSINIASGLF